MARLTDRASVETFPAGLTRRETEVLRLLARHQTDKEIAETLFISPHTASTHVKHVLTKLGASNRREAATFADDHGLG
jgi:DNA-binding CsgD family transcriptional regulator